MSDTTENKDENKSEIMHGKLSPEVKKYSKLLGTVDYDHEAAEQLAAALNEVTELGHRVTQLNQLITENKELHQFVWRAADGSVTAIHDIDDAHLVNIMLHLLRTQRAIPRAIRGEAMSRDLEIPMTVPVDWSDEPAKFRNIKRIDRGDVK